MIRSSDGILRIFEVLSEARTGLLVFLRSGDRTAFLGLLKFCPNFGQDFLLFTTPVPLKKIVYKLIEIVCKLFFLVIFVPNKQDIMKRLTAREEEIMGYFWTKGPLFVKQLLEFYDEPRPHFNTLSTIVRGLEEKGFLAHHTFGNTYQYYAAVTEADYSRSTLKNVIAKYFNNSYLGVISSLVKEEEISVEELKELIESIDNRQSTIDD